MKNVFYFLLLIVFIGCSTKSDEKKQDVKESFLEPNIFNLSFLYSEGEKIISFPVSFNDSLIQKNGIKEIERTFYFTSLDSIDAELIENEQIPDKKIKYFFNRDGATSKIQIINFYDNRLINTTEINYSDYQKDIGYAKIKMKESIGVNDFPFNEYKLIKKNEQLHVFENVFSNNKLFIIPNSKYWKSLIIDTLCHPEKEDLIVWGSLKKPFKIYSVKNLVDESNVRDFKYENGILKSVDWTDDPFKIHRTFLFNKDGVCNGFIDSTFSMGGFVASSKFLIEIKNNLPVSVFKERTNSTGNTSIFKEVFNYTF